MRKSLAPRWEEVSLRSQMEVYEAYLKNHEENEGFGFSEPASFEEFYEMCRFSTFKYIRQMYMGA